MKRKNLQLIILILTITSLVLLVGIQISWVLKSAKMQEAQFTHTVTMAMNRIVDNLSENQTICKEMNSCLRTGKAQSCFLIMKNRIEWADLDSLIKNNLKYYDINLDYEFDIVEKGKGNIRTSERGIYINDNLEKILEQSGYELILRFPEKNEFIKAQIGYIFISSIALLLLMSVSFTLIYKFYKREKKLKGDIIDFINNMTHEFKTPLTNIALANSMISRSEDIEKNEKLASYSNVIKDEHQRLKEKVEVLLRTATSEAEQSLHPEVFDASVEIRNIADTFSVRIDEKKGRIIFNTSGNNFLISGSMEMFQIAIGNIIDNAIRYCKNIPEIIISLDSEKDNILIRIQDNGIGISKENQLQIFEKFYRIPTGDIHDNEGFGLGLYFVKNTVKQMNGRIKVSSHPGRGTTFIIEIPVYKS